MLGQTLYGIFPGHVAIVSDQILFRKALLNYGGKFFVGISLRVIISECHLADSTQRSIVDLLPNADFQ
jgi:hypothetical protein